MAEGWGGVENGPDVDHGREEPPLTDQERRRLKRKFETYPRLHRWGLSFLIPRDER